MKIFKYKTLAVWGLMIIAVLFLLPLVGAADQNPEVMAMGSFSFLPLAVGSVVIPGAKPIFDWKKVKDLGTVKEVREAINEAFNHACKEIGKLPVKGQPMFGAKFTGHDSNLQGDTPVVYVMSDRRTPDRGYEKIFDPVDMRTSQSDSFDVLDVTGGITYHQVKPGQPAKLSKIPSTSKANVEMLRYIGGFSVLDDWLRFNKYYKIDQLAAQAIRDWWKQRAVLVYGLINALTGTQAFDTNDETTINNACVTILTALDTAGYDVGEGTEFVIACNPALRSRVRKALASTYESPITGSTAKQGADKVDHPVTALVSTPKITATNGYYIGVPGEKNLLGDWEDLNARPASRNELVLGSDNVWTGAYNATIGKTSQWKKCLLS